MRRTLMSMQQKYNLLKENVFDGKVEGLDAAVVVL